MFLFSGDHLQGTVFVRMQISCQSPIEWTYYSATGNIGRKDICAHCATLGAEKDRELLKQFKIVLPICETCKTNGKDILKRNPKPH